MRRRLAGASGHAEVSMTPMLDIVFILLIFFLVTSTFLEEEGVGMLAPQSDSPPWVEPPTIFVQVDRDNAVFVDGRLTDPARVAAAIQRRNVDFGGRAAVIIQPDADSEHGVVTRIYDAASAARVVGVAVRPPDRASD